MLISNCFQMRSYLVFFSAIAFLSFFSCKKNPDRVLSGFELHPDFAMELTASEPLVFDPVELHFDEAGNMYVLEMPGYPFGDSPSRLIQLRDDNGDGIVDTRLVFSDQLGVASSFLPFKKGFLVASPPELIWIADTDGDGVEDKREVLLEGFSNDNLQHNFNGLAFGLDNWIYIANGGNSGSPALYNRPETRVPLRGGDLKINYSLDQLARVGESSGGYKLTFDSWGHLFETHNLEHNLHLVFEDRYLDLVPGNPSHALANISDHESDGLSRVYPIGEQETRVNHPEQSGFFSGSCGITHYGGGIFPQEMSNGLFVADVVLNLIHFDHLNAAGSAFTTSRYGDQSEFLASTDRSFRPVNFEVGPDGSLYVLDMHREVIEHPEWIPDEIEAQLDLNAGKNQGRIYRIRPTKFTPNPAWSFESTEIVKSLGHPNQWVRNTAQRLLVTEFKEDFSADLSAAVKNPDSPLQRLHALWTLEGRGELLESDLVHALTDSVSGIRENALKIAEVHLENSNTSVPFVIDLTRDSDARVRLQALLALIGSGVIRDTAYPSDITEIANHMLDHPETDRWTQRALTAALQPQADLFLKDGLSQWNRNEHWSKVLSELAEELGRSASPKTLSNFLHQLKTSAQGVGMQKSAISAIYEGWSAKGRNPEDLTNAERKMLELTFNALEAGNERSVILATSKFRAQLNLPISDKLGLLLAQSQGFAKDSLKSATERLEWLQLMEVLPFQERSQTLVTLLDSRVPNTLQREALRQFWAANHPQVPVLLLEVWDNLGPDSRRYATDILLYKEAYHDPLLTAMESGKVKLGEFNLDLERRRALLFSEDAAIRQRAESLFSDSGVVQRADIIAQYKGALPLPGNADAGRGIFAGRCASCHKIGDLGVEVGPSLADIGRKSKETLLYDILDPNAAVDTEYLAHTVVDNTGTYYTGVVVRETDLEVELQLTGGELRKFGKDKLKRFFSSGLSLMPEGLEQGLTAQDLANLLAFLQATK